MRSPIMADVNARQGYRATARNTGARLERPAGEMRLVPAVCLLLGLCGAVALWSVVF